MKNKYNFSKYVKQQGLPINVIILGLLLSLIVGCILLTCLSVSIPQKVEYIIYTIIFILITFFLLYIADKDYQYCKKEYYQKQNTNNKSH